MFQRVWVRRKVGEEESVESTERESVRIMTEENLQTIRCC